MANQEHMSTMYHSITKDEASKRLESQTKSFQSKVVTMESESLWSPPCSFAKEEKMTRRDRRTGSQAASSSMLSFKALEEAPKRPHNKPRRITTPVTTSTLLSLCFTMQVLIAVILHELFLKPAVVEAHWIDPDTPKEAYTTMSLPVYVPPLTQPLTTLNNQQHQYQSYNSNDHDFNHHSASSNNSNTHDQRHGKKIKKPTPAPTVSESPSIPPSPSPTTSPRPTPSPTYFPTASPTAAPRRYELVFSDEFNAPGRDFSDGHDPRWTALDKNDYTNDALHYYSPDNAYTDDDGYLVIGTSATDTNIIGYDDVERKRTHVTKHFKSAMVQSWNKFCFTGGIIEAEVILPGEHNIGGLWPAFWLLGNLARHTYVGSSEHVWPWSATTCTLKSFDSQAVSGCDRATHYGFEPLLGRGAPEMDIFEVQAGEIQHNVGPFLKTPVGQPFQSASFQVAPGRPVYRPGPGSWPGPGQWYEGLKGGRNSTLNILFYGNYNHFRGDAHPEKQDYWSDAISYNRQLNASHFNEPHVFRLEWSVPDPDGSSDGYLHWFLDNELVLAINGTGVVQSGQGAEISSEPSYIIFNTAVSTQWGFPNECPSNCPCKEYDCHSNEWKQTCGFSGGFCEMMINSKPEYKVNWVRVYQDPTNPLEKVGCSTPERPTRRYIEAHEHLYMGENDVHPLQGIQRGRGICDPHASPESVDASACGGSERGHCTSAGVCECKLDWTGPNCLAHDGTDPVLYDAPDSIVDVGFIPPQICPKFLIVGLCILCTLLLVVTQYRRSLDMYSPIPDVELYNSHKNKHIFNGANGHA